MTNEQELRALDAWICHHVFKLPVDFESGQRKHGPGYLWFVKGEIGKPNQCEKVPSYTTSPADSQALLKRCAEKVSIDNPSYQTCVSIEWATDLKKWCVSHELILSHVEAETLELAICLFAKHLFSGGKD